jgi:predicted nucleic-acid-binding protein
MDLERQAYQALAEKLTKELQVMHVEEDKTMYEYHDRETIFLNCLIKHGGKAAALAAAREIDKKFKRRLEEYVQDTYA